MKRARGFTLVELIVVIVIIGVLVGTMVVFVRPAFQSYLAVGRRANLTSQADSALRMMTREVNAAVPNSLRVIGEQCVELVPTSDGGRFRMAPDIQWDAANPTNKTKPLDLTEATAEFDVLTSFTTPPAKKDLLVIGNQNVADLYNGDTWARIDAVTKVPSVSPTVTRITLSSPKQFPSGYDAGRFVVVRGSTQAVMYVCEGANEVNGTGTGTLRRYSGYGINASQNCAPTTGTRSIVARHVAECQFKYDETQNASQQSGYLQMRLRLSDSEESVSLSYGAGVDNVP